MLRAVLALALLATTATSAVAETSGNLILRGGAVYTLDPVQPWASAVVVDEGRIVYVGDEAGVAAYVTPASRVIALAGRMVLPGLHDSHSHPMSGGMKLLRCRLGDLKTEQALYDGVRNCAAARPDALWLIGSGWVLEAFGPEGPRRDKLDELVPDRPAVMSTKDGYRAWANSKALASAGLAVDAHPGIVDGEPLKVLRSHFPVPSEAEYREALRQSTAMANQVGVTSIFDAQAHPKMVAAYYAADLAGELTVRVVAAQNVDPKRGDEQVDEFIARREATRGRRFRADAAKVFIDEDIVQHSGALIEPYADQPALLGDTSIVPGTLNSLVRRFDSEGFLIHMHAMGDRAVRLGLDAIEGAIKANGERDRRHQIAHIGVADPGDFPRFAALGVAANFQPSWAHADDAANARMEAALGPQRMRWIYPIGSIAQAGGRILASSDWPSNAMNPLEGMQIALTRQPLDGSKAALQPLERVDLKTMIAAYTIEAAWVVRDETTNGSIEVGKAADLVVLDHNLFEMEVGELHKAGVLLTLLDGQPVYRDPGLAWPQ